MAHAFLRRPSAGGGTARVSTDTRCPCNYCPRRCSGNRRGPARWLWVAGATRRKGRLAARCLRTPVRTEAIDNCVCARRGSVRPARWRPAAAGARHDCVRSSLTFTDVRRGIRRLQHRNRVASRGASVAAAFKIPAPTARQTTRNPGPGPQSLRTHDTHVAKPRLSPPRHGPPTTNRPGRP